MGKPDDSDEPGTDPQPDRLDTITEDFVRLLKKRPLSPGARVGGKYRLDRRLGAGAMGEVWQATNTTIELKVAIKLLKPELLSDAKFRTRFQQEAQALASVTHPNVARFYDIVVGDPTFMVMEFVNGTNLKTLLDTEKKLEPERALTIAVGVARALEVVHAAGVVHRDLKPSNIMITVGRDGDEEARIIDFGLAKVAEKNRGDGITLPGQMIGTPHYMAPEQIAGRPVEPRTDIYALGCVLFHMLTGAAPFGGEGVEVLYKHVHSAVPSMPGVSQELAQVVAKSLSKLPADRQRSAGELARSLERLLAQYRTASQFFPLLGPSRRGRLGALAGGLVLLGFALGGAIFHRGRPAGEPSSSSGALLIVDSRPPGARVILDGRPLAETTPTALRGVAPGRHEVRFEREGAAGETRVIDAEAGGRTLVSVALAPPTRTVEVRTRPPGAVVFLDNALAGNASPVQVLITTDEPHALRVEKDGYESATAAVKPEDQTPAVEIDLQPEKLHRGALVVDANTAAEVWIDGAWSGFMTPTMPMRIPPGKHLIELRDGDGNRLTQTTVKIVRGETRRLFLGGR
jgi:serine/threonine-protein kinase